MGRYIFHVRGHWLAYFTFSGSCCYPTLRRISATYAMWHSRSSVGWESWNKLNKACFLFGKDLVTWRLSNFKEVADRVFDIAFFCRPMRPLLQFRRTTGSLYPFDDHAWNEIYMEPKLRVGLHQRNEMQRNATKRNETQWMESVVDLFWFLVCILK